MATGRTSLAVGSSDTTKRLKYNVIIYSVSWFFGGCLVAVFCAWGGIFFTEIRMRLHRGRMIGGRLATGCRVVRYGWTWRSGGVNLLNAGKKPKCNVGWYSPRTTITETRNTLSQLPIKLSELVGEFGWFCAEAEGWQICLWWPRRFWAVVLSSVGGLRCFDGRAAVLVKCVHR